MKEKIGSVLGFIVLAAIVVTASYLDIAYGDGSNNSASSEISNCSPDYNPCVTNESYDLSCDDVGQEVEVIGTDVYGLDGDSDGWGCEGY